MPLFELDGKRPQVHEDAWIAPTAVLIGDVRVGAGDDSYIEVGEGSNVQDGCLVHCSNELPTIIGRRSSLGHHACIEGCVVGDGALVGTGAIMLQRSRVADGAVLAAGSVLLEGQEVPSGQLAAGSPATVRKAVSGSSAEWAVKPAIHYREQGVRYKEQLRRLD
jgi:carbonic anhydrase/acetyltransferase-like protein (isoleucine patch superfamily)